MLLTFYVLTHTVTHDFKCGNDLWWQLRKHRYTETENAGWGVIRFTVGTLSNNIFSCSRVYGKWRRVVFGIIAVAATVRLILRARKLNKQWLRNASVPIRTMRCAYYATRIILHSFYWQEHFLSTETTRDTSYYWRCILAGECVIMPNNKEFLKTTDYSKYFLL
jgi:hypothetical protein